MIKGGYYLKARQIKESVISKAAPCTREVWDYLLREAYFMDTKTHLSGQLTRSYNKIIEDLSWGAGVRSEFYDTVQVKRAMVFLRKHQMITTKRVPCGVLISVCNYRYFQEKRNYESTKVNSQEYSNHSALDHKNPYESTETPYESTRNEPTESTNESTKLNCEDGNILNDLEAQNPYESTNESTNESTRIEPTIENIQQYRSNKSIVYKKILPDPEIGENDFERDRRIFFAAFPGVKTFQTFDDNSDRKSKKLIKQFHIKDLMTMDVCMELEKRNSYGAGVYLTINETNGKARTATDIVKVRAAFADCDECPIDPVWEYEPSMVIESSPGKYHAYWLSPDIPLDGFRQLQESIIAKFGSDLKVKDLPRVMRVPGFEHRKAKPFLSKLIHYTGQQYAFDYLTELFPPPPREKWSAPKYQTDLPSDGEFKGQYGASEGGRNNHLVARIGGMLKRKLSWTEIECEAFKEAAACSPPLSEAEVKAALRSCRRYA